MNDERCTLQLRSLRISFHYRLLVGAIVAVYVVIAALYAAITPAWQVPDEPAHYNYVRSLAQGDGFPVLERGDYDQAYLEALTSEGFPSDLPIEPLEYEDHQPPLYYVLATPIYLAFGGALLPLRLISVTLGAGLLVVAFRAIRTVIPNRPWLASAAAGFIAFIPQHVAMTAGVNNDVLAELVVAGTLWASVAYLGEAKTQPWHIGVLVGIALLTKTTAYVVVGVAAGAVALRWKRDEVSLGWAVGQLAQILLPAVVISAPWLIRNAMIYGWSDPLGLAQHKAVVESQPRSSEWMALYGFAGLLRRLIRTTFQSFWGQFGWMALPLPTWIYGSLLALSLLLGAGFVGWLVGTDGRRAVGEPVCRRLSLLALSALLTLMAFLWYNLTFVQHQGRYLFPALIPLSTAAVLGLRTLATLLPRQVRPWTLLILVGGLATLDLYCLWKVIYPNL